MMCDIPFLRRGAGPLNCDRTTARTRIPFRSHHLGNRSTRPAHHSSARHRAGAHDFAGGRSTRGRKPASVRAPQSGDPSSTSIAGASINSSGGTNRCRNGKETVGTSAGTGSAGNPRHSGRWQGTAGRDGDCRRKAGECHSAANLDEADKEEFMPGIARWSPQLAPAVPTDPTTPHSTTSTPQSPCRSNVPISRRPHNIKSIHHDESPKCLGMAAKW